MSKYVSQKTDEFMEYLDTKDIDPESNLALCIAIIFAGSEKNLESIPCLETFRHETEHKLR